MFKAIYADGTIREFSTDDFDKACKMANAYSGPIKSVEKADGSPIEVVEPPELDIKSINRMVMTGHKVPKRKG